MNKAKHERSERVLPLDADGDRAWVLTGVGAACLGASKVVTVLRDFGVPQDQGEDTYKECCG
jgi:hypothetical protein